MRDLVAIRNDLSFITVITFTLNVLKAFVKVKALYSVGNSIM